MHLRLQILHSVQDDKLLIPSSLFTLFLVIIINPLFLLLLVKVHLTKIPAEVYANRTERNREVGRLIEILSVNFGFKIFTLVKWVNYV